MQEENSISPGMRKKVQAADDIKNLTKIFMLVWSHKYLIICITAILLTLAYFYNKYTIPVYRVSAAILIEEDKKNSATGNNQLLEGFGLMPGMKNFDNQMIVLSSRTLINKTLDELSLDMEYYTKGFLGHKSLYPVQPIEIITDSGGRLPENVVFSFRYLGSDSFNLQAGSRGSFKINRNYSFGENISLPGVSFRIEPKQAGFFNEKNSRKIYFLLHSRTKLVESYLKRLKVERASKLGSIVRISLEGTNYLEDLIFLQKLSEIFLNISLERKNNEAVRTIQFIDDQLAGISDSLVITENKLQQFRSRNKVMNLSAQGQVIINQAMSLENEKARLGLEANYYDYLKGYLEKNSAGEVPISPATMGISDPGLTKLVADLSEQQSKLYSKSMGEKNPLQNQLSQKVASIKEALRETLNGLSSANDLALKENEQQINSLNGQATALPMTERQLLGIERKYKLNDELYTFLLEKRAVAQMQKASNVADNEMVEYPEFENDPVKPNVILTYLIALMAGLGIPVLWILLADIFSVRIRRLAELSSITDLPVSGYVPHSILKKTKIVLDEPDSPMAESYRLVRSKMIFFTKNISKPVIVITSSSPGEGKTLTAINLASAYSLLGKKTILIGFDLRKPNIHNEFEVDNDHGISTWLIGSANIEDIIHPTKYENLHVITSGPVPPNPAELSSSSKTKELIEILRKSYDCIVIDTAPIGVVSDSFHLVTLADACILVVRQNITFKELLSDTLKDLQENNVKGLSLIVNDIDYNGFGYGYGGRYNYKYKEEKRKPIPVMGLLTHKGIRLVKR